MVNAEDVFKPSITMDGITTSYFSDRDVMTFLATWIDESNAESLTQFFECDGRLAAIVKFKPDLPNAVVVKFEAKRVDDLPTVDVNAAIARFDKHTFAKKFLKM